MRCVWSGHSGFFLSDLWQPWPRCVLELRLLYLCQDSPLCVPLPSPLQPSPLPLLLLFRFFPCSLFPSCTLTEPFMPQQSRLPPGVPSSSLEPALLARCTQRSSVSQGWSDLPALGHLRTQTHHPAARPLPPPPQPLLT